MSFRIRALPADDFADLSRLDHDALSARLIRRLVADEHPGYPCRVSLEDARLGETVFLLHFTHQIAATPFRASHAIYVREGALSAHPEVDEVPEMIRQRIISLRAFDGEGFMVNADVTDGEDVAEKIEAMLSDPASEYIHLHFAKQGCFAARADRA